MMSLKTTEKMTKLSEESQKKKLRLFVRLSLEEKLHILKQQKSIFHKLKNEKKEIDNSLLTLITIILAIDRFDKENNGLKKNVSIFKGTKKKENFKRSKILTLWSIVKELREKRDMSFREISNYLKKYHKFEISYSTIYQMWDEIEKRN